MVAYTWSSDSKRNFFSKNCQDMFPTVLEHRLLIFFQFFGRNKVELQGLKSAQKWVFGKTTRISALYCSKFIHKRKMVILEKTAFISGEAEVSASKWCPTWYYNSFFFVFRLFIFHCSNVNKHGFLSKRSDFRPHLFKNDPKLMQNKLRTCWSILRSKLVPFSWWKSFFLRMMKVDFEVDWEKSEIILEKLWRMKLLSIQPTFHELQSESHWENLISYRFLNVESIAGVKIEKHFFLPNVEPFWTFEGLNGP